MSILYEILKYASRIKYIDDSATLEITFAPDVVPLITRLEKHFTSYQIKQVEQLTGKYAIRLAEMLLQPEKFKQLYSVLEKAGFNQ